MSTCKQSMSTCILIINYVRGNWLQIYATIVDVKWITQTKIAWLKTLSIYLHQRNCIKLHIRLTIKFQSDEIYVKSSHSVSKRKLIILLIKLYSHPFITCRARDTAQSLWLVLLLKDWRGKFESLQLLHLLHCLTSHCN